MARDNYIEEMIEASERMMLLLEKIKEKYGQNNYRTKPN